MQRFGQQRVGKAERICLGIVKAAIHKGIDVEIKVFDCIISDIDRLDEGMWLLFRQGIAPHASYLFKHALVQDAAYGTLLREPRRALHASIVEAFEIRFPEIAESQPEVLARHCTEAGQFETRYQAPSL